MLSEYQSELLKGFGIVAVELCDQRSLCFPLCFGVGLGGGEGNMTIVCHQVHVAPI